MLKKLIPHVCIVLSLMMLTFYVVDEFNPGMNFIGNVIFKVLLVVYGIVTITASVFLIAGNKHAK